MANVWTLYNYTGPLVSFVLLGYLVFATSTKLGLTGELRHDTVAATMIAAAAVYLCAFHSLVSIRIELFDTSLRVLDWLDTRGHSIALAALSFVTLIVVLLIISGTTGSTASAKYLFSVTFAWAIGARWVLNFTFMERAWTSAILNRSLLIVATTIWLIMISFLSLNIGPDSSWLWMACGAIAGIAVGTLLLDWIMLHLSRFDRFETEMVLHSAGVLCDKKELGLLPRRLEWAKSVHIRTKLLLYGMGILSIGKFTKSRNLAIGICINALRFHRFDLVARITDDYCGPESARLCSIRALALRGLGRRHDALCTLMSLSNWSSNPHILLNAGLLHSELGDFENAIAVTRRAMELAGECPIGLNNLAYFQIERELSSARAIQELPGLINTVELSYQLSKRALTLRDQHTYMHPSLLDTFGYLHLLRGEAKDTSVALRSLTCAMFSSNAARYHLSLFMMIGSETMLHAEVLLRTVIRRAQLNDETHLEELGRKNLQKVKMARASGRVFSPVALYFHHLQYADLPADAFAVGENRELHRKRMKRITWARQQLFQNAEYMSVMGIVRVAKSGIAEISEVNSRVGDGDIS